MELSTPLSVATGVGPVIPPSVIAGPVDLVADVGRLGEEGSCDPSRFATQGGPGGGRRPLELAEEVRDAELVNSDDEMSTNAAPWLFADEGSLAAPVDAMAEDNTADNL